MVFHKENQHSVHNIQTALDPLHNIVDNRPFGEHPTLYKKKKKLDCKSGAEANQTFILPTWTTEFC